MEVTQKQSVMKAFFFSLASMELPLNLISKKIAAAAATEAIDHDILVVSED